MTDPTLEELRRRFRRLRRRRPSDAAQVASTNDPSLEALRHRFAQRRRRRPGDVVLQIIPMVPGPGEGAYEVFDYIVPRRPAAARNLA